jgi:hypothetical protein
MAILGLTWQEVETVGVGKETKEGKRRYRRTKPTANERL